MRGYATKPLVPMTCYPTTSEGKSMLALQNSHSWIVDIYCTFEKVTVIAWGIKKESWIEVPALLAKYCKGGFRFLWPSTLGGLGFVVNSLNQRQLKREIFNKQQYDMFFEFTVWTTQWTTQHTGEQDYIVMLFHSKITPKLVHCCNFICNIKNVILILKYNLEALASLVAFWFLFSL